MRFLEKVHKVDRHWAEEAIHHENLLLIPQFFGPIHPQIKYLFLFNVRIRIFNYCHIYFLHNYFVRTDATRTTVQTEIPIPE